MTVKQDVQADSLGVVDNSGVGEDCSRAKSGNDNLESTDESKYDYAGRAVLTFSGSPYPSFALSNHEPPLAVGS